MFNRVLILFSFITGFSIFAETASNKPQSVQNWMLQEITSNPNIKPFPEYIKINFTNENEGILVIKLLAQHTEKNYPFSKKAPGIVESVQNYDNDGEYSLKETVSTSF